MKKLLLSLSIIGAITIGGGAIAFASDNNGGTIKEDTTINEEITNNEEENYIDENSYCTYYGENNETQNNEEGKGNIDGLQSTYKSRGRCGGSRSNMMGY